MSDLLTAEPRQYLWVRPGYHPGEHDWHAITDCLPATTDTGSYAPCSTSVLLWMEGHLRTGYLRVDPDEADSACWLLDGRDAYTAHGVTDWRWLPDPPPRGGRAEADPLSAALARVRASAAQLGRTIEEWESKFGRNQENLR